MSSSNKKALVIIDVQNDFTQGALANADATSKVADITKLAESWKGPVFLTQDTHDENYNETQEGTKLPVPHCIKGTNGWNLAAPLDKAEQKHGWPIFEKPTFGSTQLAEHLSQLYAEGAITSVLLVGFCTDICVVSNALLIKAYAPELKVEVDAALCSGTSKKAHDSALATMQSCQVDVENF